MKFVIYRKIDNWRLRKWRIDCFAKDGTLLDSRLLFGGPGFKRRAARKIKRMRKMRQIADRVVFEA